MFYVWNRSSTVIAMIVDIWSYPLIIGEPVITPPVKRPKRGIKLSSLSESLVSPSQTSIY